MSQTRATTFSSALECFRTPKYPYLHPKPLPGRGQPVKAGAARATAQRLGLDGVAPVRPHQDMQVQNPTRLSG